MLSDDADGVCLARNSLVLKMSKLYWSANTLTGKAFHCLAVHISNGETNRFVGQGGISTTCSYRLHLVPVFLLVIFLKGANFWWHMSCALVYLFYRGPAQSKNMLNWSVQSLLKMCYFSKPWASCAIIFHCDYRYAIQGYNNINWNEQKWRTLEPQQPKNSYSMKTFSIFLNALKKNKIEKPWYFSVFFDDVYHIILYRPVNCPVGLVVTSATAEHRVLGSIPGSGKSAIEFF